MSNPFEILSKFLDRYDDEVAGRESEAPAADVQVRLRELAVGRLPATEREVLLVQLHQKPGWVVWLANEVKSLRDASRPGPKDIP